MTVSKTATNFVKNDATVSVMVLIVDRIIVRTSAETVEIGPSTASTIGKIVEKTGFKKDVWLVDSGSPCA